MQFIKQYLEESKQIIDQIDAADVAAMLDILVETKRNGGRLFFLGVGGGAGHAAHAVNDFRKLAGIETYAPTDNVSELTARTNDEGWETVFVEWLKTSRLSPRDTLFVISVGGGSLENNVSPNIVRAVQLGREVGCRIIGVVGRNGGYTAEVADACVIVPTVNAANVTPHTESFQALLWHLLVSHPRLRSAIGKWETVQNNAGVRRAAA
jgi:D-sedoheptulose 7-phosphate isomerase